MRCLILVGGFGTRLRPLTLTRPKPLVPFANKAMVLHQVEALIKVGVKEVILAVSYHSAMFETQLDDWSKQYGIKFTCSHEDEPLGTGGPLALARAHLTAEEGPFFVLNSDVICAYEEKNIFARMIAFHKAHGKEGTMLVTKVTDPSKYGVVVSEEKTGKIHRFVEKPQDWVGDQINAGIYLFNQSMLKRVQLRPTSIEKEIFPAMAKDGELFAQSVDGYWMDVGQPKDYLIGMGMYLASPQFHHSKMTTKFDNAPRFRGSVLVHPSAKFGKNCVIGPNVIIGANVVVGSGVVLKRTTLMDGVVVGDKARLVHTIVAFDCNIGQGSLLSRSVLGDKVVIKEGSTVLESKIDKASGDAFPSHSAWLKEVEAAATQFIKLPKAVAEVLALVSAANPEKPSEADYPLALQLRVANLGQKKAGKKAKAAAAAK